MTRVRHSNNEFCFRKLSGLLYTTWGENNTLKIFLLKTIYTHICVCLGMCTHNTYVHIHTYICVHIKPVSSSLSRSLAWTLSHLDYWNSFLTKPPDLLHVLSYTARIALLRKIVILSFYSIIFRIKIILLECLTQTA